ncbi:MAG: aromatic ring-hydroxylating oxygenase subunit alpha, partial [Acidimicrobiales bacterium]
MAAVGDRSFIPKHRYIDPEFAALENERLWSRVWQVACREEDVPDVGDFVEYVIGDQSVLIVRVAAEEIGAYGNACRHRATELAMGSGTFAAGQIVCPFHGWRWRLDGSNAGVYGGHTFAPEVMTPDQLCLRAYRVDTWAGCVWITLDDAAPPLAEQIAPMADLLDPLRIADMRVRWWKHTILAANWKLAQEAFMEGFHVRQTHPQLEPDDGTPDSLAYAVHANGHSSFQNVPRRNARPLTLEEIIATSRSLWTGLDAMTLERDVRVLESLRDQPVPEDGSYGAMFIAAMYAQAARDGIDLPAPDRETLARWGGMFFTFPNYFVLPQYGNALLYRFRPLTPESCMFELWSVTLPAAGDAPTRPCLEGPFRPDDTDAWPLIPLQDFSNIERQQRGLHSHSVDGVRLSQVYEAGIVNM